jgi:hypothetical protein
VWLGDCRGNHNSPTNNFDFTFDEMAAKDLPALLNGVSAGTARAQWWGCTSGGSLRLFAQVRAGVLGAQAGSVVMDVDVIAHSQARFTRRAAAGPACQSLTAGGDHAHACAQGSAITFIHLIGNQLAAPQVKVGRDAAYARGTMASRCDAPRHGAMQIRRFAAIGPPLFLAETPSTLFKARAKRALSWSLRRNHSLSCLLAATGRAQVLAKSANVVPNFILEGKLNKVFSCTLANVK